MPRCSARAAAAVASVLATAHALSPGREAVSTWSDWLEKLWEAHENIYTAKGDSAREVLTRYDVQIKLYRMRDERWRTPERASPFPAWFEDIESLITDISDYHAYIDECTEQGVVHDWWADCDGRADKHLMISPARMWLELEERSREIQERHRLYEIEGKQSPESWKQIPEIQHKMQGKGELNKFAGDTAKLLAALLDAAPKQHVDWLQRLQSFGDLKDEFKRDLKTLTEKSRAHFKDTPDTSDKSYTLAKRSPAKFVSDFKTMLKLLLSLHQKPYDLALLMWLAKLRRGLKTNGEGTVFEEELGSISSISIVDELLDQAPMESFCTPFPVPDCISAHSPETVEACLRGEIWGI